MWSAIRKQLPCIKMPFELPWRQDVLRKHTEWVTNAFVFWMFWFLTVICSKGSSTTRRTRTTWRTRSASTGSWTRSVRCACHTSMVRPGSPRDTTMWELSALSLERCQQSSFTVWYVCFQGMRNRRERMPPPDNNVDPGKVICYPQKHWHKKRYQYLKYFMAPKHR